MELGQESIACPNTGRPCPVRQSLASNYRRQPILEGMIKARRHEREKAHEGSHTDWVKLYDTMISDYEAQLKRVITAIPKLRALLELEGVSCIDRCGLEVNARDI